MVREIKNKTLRNELKKNGLENVHLYKDCTNGYFFIDSTDEEMWNKIYLSESNSIYINDFCQQSIECWINDIKDIINH